jgi:hypothetical protein
MDPGTLMMLKYDVDGVGGAGSVCFVIHANLDHLYRTGDDETAFVITVIINSVVTRIWSDFVMPVPGLSVSRHGTLGFHPGGMGSTPIQVTNET